MEMDSGKLFIGGISWETTEERLTDYFQTFGEVVQAVILKDRITGRSRGFGFIVFASAAVSERVLKGRHIIDGRAVEAKRAVPRDDHQNSTRNNGGAVQSSPSPARTRKIFVGGLASTITEIEFKRYFDQFGTTTDAVVMYDHNTGRPRGFGFVTYDSEEALDKVLANTFHDLNGKMVEVKRAVPKELSPVPTRSQPSGYNLNRLSSFLNAHTQGYYSSSAGGFGMRMDGRFSPATAGRNGYPPHSPSKYDIGLNLDMGFGLNYGAIGDSVNGNERGVLPHYTGNSNIFSNSISGNVGSFGDMWDFSHVSTQVEGTGSLLSGSMGYGSGERNFVGRETETNIRNNGGSTGSTLSYFVTNNVRESGLENIYEGHSFFGDRGGRLLPLELEGSSSFDYVFETTSPNVTPKNSIGYVGDYIANRATRTNRGIAA